MMKMMMKRMKMMTMNKKLREKQDGKKHDSGQELCPEEKGVCFYLVIVR